MKHISIIVPIFNEEKNIQKLYRQLYETIQNLLSNYTFEIIFVNDGSKDNSWHEIEKLTQQNPRITGICLQRNFGHQAALFAGYDHATGDAIITIDADLQDPPALIGTMLAAWQKGYDVVYAQRAHRSDSFFKRKTADYFYIILSMISDVRIPRNVGDFRLIDKKVLTFLRTIKDASPYLRGIVAWPGFTHTFVQFERPNRVAGSTGYTWAKMMKLAFDGVTNFSLFPLKLAAFIGIFVIITGMLMFGYVTIDTLLFKKHYPLFKWLVIIMYIFMGVQFLLMWIIGEYIGRIFEQQKNRPRYIIKKILGNLHD